MIEIASSAILIGLSLLIIWLYRAYKSKKTKEEVEGY
jgi:hypothetical protein